ncbi:peptide/nickel transport system permease protein [Brevibacterium iodinum ATCC 49514]|uniref:Peptide/nickel transport system permease protein n=1 Tax=Brevibacterium iodinum ATCC 49514 TaxID=1255616 RepID=A0A2H1HVS0_9MICO|nr:ABC transporter permease [Brevibacterium iodinum]SMX67033.1 peptide/nickel transport system permease protein [Brevibacterium iodinum ATCC 49514]SUW13661.1 Glutathione transport system permease protein gsiD [Brevibacterium iodinum]
MSANTPAEAAPGPSSNEPNPRGSETRGSTPAVDGAKLVRERRLNNAKKNWALFRSDVPALIGAVVLLFFIVIAIAAPLIAPASMLDVTKQLDVPRYAPPSLDHPLGTDDLGRELWVRILWGARVSILVGVAATVMSMIIGTIMGLAAGHFTGLFGGIIMRIVDFFIVLPSLLLAIVLSSVLERGVFTIVVAIGLTSWASTARIVRSQTLSVESRLYIERARILGAGHSHILFRHLLPAVMPLVLANTTLTVGGAIIAESTLSFLGLGDTSKESWGTILKNSMDVSAATSGYWWYVLTPGVAILLVVLAFTMVGRAFEAIINPALRSR